jgi:hypothetical protein
MATADALPQSQPVQPGTAAGELAAILAGSLPVLPTGGVGDVAAELRAMSSEAARAVWVHPGWAALVDWILRRVPDCDPTTAAVHAVRNATHTRVDQRYAVSLARYLKRIAEGCSLDRLWVTDTAVLTWDPPEPEHAVPAPSMSLALEAGRLLASVGVEVSRPAWALVAASVDIAVDWWNGLAERTGLEGDDLIQAARRSNRMPGDWRLRSHFDGPAARPLVALLVGGDQMGRQARRQAGMEVGLVYWALLARQADQGGQTPPVPPAPVARAWATSIGWVEKAVAPSADSTGVAMGPIVAA